MENPIKMDDLGVPLFLETPIYIYIYIFVNMCVSIIATIHDLLSNVGWPTL